MSVHADNEAVLSALSRFLNATPTAITPEALRTMTDIDLTEEQGYLHLLSVYLELPSQLWRQYLPRMLHLLDAASYAADPCMQAIRSAAGIHGGIVLCEEITPPASCLWRMTFR